MALREGISAEASQLLEYGLGGLFGDAVFYCAFDEDGFQLIKQLEGVLAAQSAAQQFTLTVCETADVMRYL